MKCPKCNRELESIGVLTADGVELPVFQCGDCTTSWEVEGERFEVALTFALTPNGDMIDPETLDSMPPRGPSVN